jgi:hypothetical protein
VKHCDRVERQPMRGSGGAAFSGVQWCEDEDLLAVQDEICAKVLIRCAKIAYLLIFCILVQRMKTQLNGCMHNSDAGRFDKKLSQSSSSLEYDFHCDQLGQHPALNY